MRRFCCTTAVVVAFLLSGAVAQAGAKPNVIIIIADSLGWDGVSYNGGGINTPAIDGLVSRGVKLDRFYVSPLGSPTRASLMTGRHPIRLGVAYADFHPWDNLGVHPGEHFMSQSFKQAGYQTAFIGSWGLGHAQETYHPNQRGLDDFWGQLLLGSALNPPYHNLGGVDVQYNGNSTGAGGAYMPQWIGERASALIRDHKQDQPLFLMLSFPSSRKGNTPSAQSFADCPPQKKPCAAYTASIEAMDAAVDQLVQTLAAQGMSDNTMVLFMSDSGRGTGNEDSLDKTELRGARGQTLEGGIHVPAALVWPAELAANRRFGSIVTMMDVFPTLAAAAGIETGNDRKLDGVNLWPAISAGKRVQRREPVVLLSEAEQYGHFDLTAFDDEWKLVQNIQVDLVYINVQDSLYRSSEAVDENNDLASRYPDQVERLGDAIKAMRQQHPINGLRNTMVPPAGWRGPKDWAQYPIAVSLLQSVTAAGAPPPFARRPLDYQLGEKGRLIYDCEIKWWSLGFCIKGVEEDIAVYDFHNRD
jgi:arylsulfatase A-like enzyme